MLKPKLAVSTQILNPLNAAEWPARLLELRGLSYEGIGVDLSGQGSGGQVADLLAMAGVSGLSVAWVQGEFSSVSEGPEQVKALCELGQALGTVNICLREGSVPADTERDRVTWSATRWKEAALVAAQHGQRVLWAFGRHDSETAPSTGVIEAVLRKVDEPNFGLVFDTEFMHRLALAERHEQIEEGRPIKGALGLVERYKGWIGSIRLSGYAGETVPMAPDQPPPIDWDRLIPSLADAWVPDSGWSLVVPSLAEAGPLARSLRLRLAPYLSELSAS